MIGPNPWVSWDIQQRNLCDYPFGKEILGVACQVLKVFQESRWHHLEKEKKKMVLIHRFWNVEPIFLCYVLSKPLGDFETFK